MGSKGLKTINEARDAVASAEAKDIRIFDLEHENSKLKQSVKDLERKVKDSEDKVSILRTSSDGFESRANKAEKELGELRAQVANYKSPEVVIAEFRGSQEYFTELGKKSAAKICRS